MQIYEGKSYTISIGDTNQTGRPILDWVPVKVNNMVLIIDNDGKTLATIKLFQD